MFWLAPHDSLFQTQVPNVRGISLEMTEIFQITQLLMDFQRFFGTALENERIFSRGIPMKFLESDTPLS